MQPGKTNPSPVDLTAYRKRKAESERVVIPDRELDAEETITEIARYVLLIVQAIRRPRH